MYRFKAINDRNELIEGELEAQSEHDAFEQLHRRGLYPVEAAQRGAGGFADLIPRGLTLAPKITAKDVTLLTKQLAALLQAKIEVERALGILITLSEKPVLRQTLGRLRDAIRGGQPIAEAFAQFMPSLPAYYAGMVRAGELSGTLESTFERLAAFMKRTQDTRDAVTSKLIYPAILVVTAGLSLVILVTVVLPQFEPIFRDAGQQLPLVARFFLWVAHVIGAYWWLFLALGIAAALLIRRQFRQAAFRQRFDAWLLRAPLIGSIVLRIVASRFCRTLGTLLGNGVPVATAMPSAIASVGNRAMAATLERAAERVRQGSGIAAALGDAAPFPELARQLAGIGEESGRLDQMLLQAADLYDQEVERRIQRLVALLTPTITIVLGVVVAAVISSVLMAVLSINDLAM